MVNSLRSRPGVVSPPSEQGAPAPGIWRKVVTYSEVDLGRNHGDATGLTSVSSLNLNQLDSYQAAFCRSATFANTIDNAAPPKVFTRVVCWA